MVEILANMEKYDEAIQAYCPSDESPGSTDRKWKIAFMHVPFYSTTDCYARDDDGRKYFQPLFEKYGVNLVIAGHIHLYSRTMVNETPYLILAGGGATLGPPHCGDSTDHKCHICDKDHGPCPNSGCHDFIAYQMYHFAYFTINDNEMACKVIDENSSIIDEFSIYLQPPPSHRS